MFANDVLSFADYPVHFVETDELEAIVATARAAGFLVAELDGSSVEPPLFVAVGAVLKSPLEAVGWDSLQDILRDFSWVDAPGYVLAVSGALDLWQKDPRSAGTLVECVQSASLDWRHWGKPMHLVFAW